MPTVATWNLLADAYISPERYPNTPAERLDASARRPALLRALASLRADILCLQEVEPELYGLIAESLPDYSGAYLQKPGRPEGCATFVRGPFERRDLIYADGSEHVALIVAQGGIELANTHLRWGHSLPQLRELLDAVKLPAALCGDFNAEPASEDLACAAARGYRDAHPAAAFTFNGEGRARKIDYILISPGLEARPVAARVITGATPLPSTEVPSDHIWLSAQIARRQIATKI